MISDMRVAQIIDDLDAALRGPLAVRPVDCLDAFVAAGTSPRYLREPRLTIALHFDIQPAFLILDPRLGTLGIVKLLTPKSGDETIGNQVHRCIDRAAYMRHLLLRDRTPGLWRPITVELVLVTADEMQDEKLALDAIGVALRDVLRDTDSLFHIGVGVLCHGGSNVRFEGRLRRAFPWLLTTTRRWRADWRRSCGCGQTLDALKKCCSSFTATTIWIAFERKLRLPRIASRGSHRAPHRPQSKSRPMVLEATCLRSKASRVSTLR